MVNELEKVDLSAQSGSADSSKAFQAEMNKEREERLKLANAGPNQAHEGARPGGPGGGNHFPTPGGGGRHEPPHMPPPRQEPPRMPPPRHEPPPPRHEPPHFPPPRREPPPDRRPPGNDHPPQRRPPGNDHDPNRRPPDRRPPGNDHDPNRRPPDRRPPGNDHDPNRRPPDRRPPGNDHPPDRRPPGNDHDPNRRPPDRRPPGNDHDPNRRPPDRRPPGNDHDPNRRPPDRRPPGNDHDPNRRPPGDDHRHPPDRRPPGHDHGRDRFPLPGHGRWEPPHGHGWGWHDQPRWDRGYDPWFFEQDPNNAEWRDPIENEAGNAARLLDSGLTEAAAQKIQEDLYALRGDMYAQDQLLYKINSNDLKGFGGDLILDKWNPERGTWDDVRIIDNNGGPDIPIRTFGYDDPPPWGADPVPPDQLPPDDPNAPIDPLMQSDKSSEIYIVKPGDSLSKIAKNRLDEKSVNQKVQNYVDDIVDLNNIANPHRIDVGQRLKMPPLPLR